MGKIKVIAIMGKAGSGKDTLLKNFIKLKEDKYHLVYDGKKHHKVYDEVFDEKYNIVTPFTTRPMREGEEQDKTYHFLPEENIGNLIESGVVAQVTDFRGWLYGFLWNDFKEDKVNIGIFTPRAIDYLMDYVDLDITPVYIMATDKERLIRQLDREENPDVKEIIRRYGTDEEDFDEEELKYLPPIIRLENHSYDDEEVNANMFYQLTCKFIDIVDQWAN